MTQHPALTLIHTGRTAEAAAYLVALDDPRVAGAIDHLRRGSVQAAGWILEDLPPHVVGRAPGVVA